MLGVLLGDAGDADWEGGGSFSMRGGSYCRLNEPPRVCWKCWRCWPKTGRLIWDAGGVAG